MTIERKVEANTPPTLSVTVNQPEFVPDTGHIYLLKYEHSALSNDDVTVTTNEKDLVAAVTTVTEDPVPAAVREFANFVIGVATSGIKPPTAAAAAEEPRADIHEGAFKVEARFGPARTQDGGDDLSWTDLRDHLLNQYGVSIDRTPPDLLGSPTNEAVAARCEEMVCYRFVLPYRITVKDSISNGQAEAVVLLPNEGPIAGIKVIRRSFVENKFTLTFSNGVLTSAHYEDPSALVGALMIPIYIAKTIVSILSALFRFTIAHEQTDLAAEKAVVQAQKDLAQAQLELLQKEQKLKEAQRPGPGEN